MNIDELYMRIEELEQRVAAYEKKSGYQTAKDMITKAEAWIARNPKAWALIKDHAQMCALHKGRFSIKRTLEELRDSSLVNMTDDDYKISNNYSAVFNRFLIRELPEIARYTVIKPSKIDYYFPDVTSIYKAAKNV